MSYDEGRLWYGVALSGFGIIYNRCVIESQKLPLPRTWEDLAKPAYFTWIGSGDPLKTLPHGQAGLPRDRSRGRI